MATGEATVFEKAYQQGYRPGADGVRRAPWDIGRAQPAVVELVEKGAFKGDVLDIGCGLGDNAIHLASAGLNVTGIDSAPSAVRTAMERAAGKGLSVEFAVAEATSLAGFENRFDSILDSGLYHCLKPEDRAPYVAALARVARPGAQLHLFSFTNELPEAFLVTVGEDTIRGDFAGEWSVESLTKARYETALTLARLSARVPGMGEDGLIDGEPCPGVEVDENGTVWFDAWQLAARRV
jgi:2-polyprenyl-3-methyl-5-hydroxy-6-metoxy-1,4-benzoquinol methylase